MIVVPHTDLLAPATAAWAAANRAVLWEINPADPGRYWRVLADLWAMPGDLTIVEHDMIPADGVVESMGRCRRLWCVSPYRIQAGWARESLGCTRFAARLKSRLPDLLVRVGSIGEHDVAARDWRRLDVRLAALLRALGYRPHQHRRSTHLHDYRAAP